jgi:ABC-type transport system involved in multi-copper enzyme maturation permease subunit
VLRAEWTKFRTVPAWVSGMVAAAAVIVLLGLAVAAGSRTVCPDGPCPAPPVGPGGQAVDDRFSFAHRTLDGDGSLTARVASLTGIITYPPPDNDRLVTGVVPWAKAGIMVKDGTKPGSRYAAVLLTGSHGVRLQHDFTHDQAGPAAARWLRLDRAGDTVTASASADGTAWTRVGAAHLAGLPRTVQIGLFVASPGDVSAAPNARGGHSVRSRFTQATAAFDQVTPGGGWTFDQIGEDGSRTDWERWHQPAGLVAKGGTLTLTGSGDIAPAGLSAGPGVERTLFGIFAALFVVIVVAVLFITGEYRRGLIRTTLLAAPQRHRMLLAKAVVIGAVTFVAGLVAAAVTVPWAVHVLRSGGNFVASAGAGATLRVIVGSALLLSVTALLAYALGALLRRGVAAVAAAVLLILVPYLLATASVLPAGPANWLLRVTPAAGFAIQQTIPLYAQVQYPYGPADGFFPLAPWAGLAVAAAWAFGLLGLALVRLRRGDA